MSNTDSRKPNWGKSAKKTRGEKIIRLPALETSYLAGIAKPEWFHGWVQQGLQNFSALFPTAILQGYELHDIRESEKLKLPYRRIRLKATGEVFTIQPDFVMPYMSGKTEECQKGLLLIYLGVPLWAVVYCFGGDEAKWYRRFNHLGRFSIVGTTIKAPALLPAHLSSDEKITFCSGREVYGCVTSAGECILGADLSLSEDEKGLGEGYAAFKQEALDLQPGYSPRSVNTDGWPATKKAWQRLFAGIGLILCFLHGFIKIRRVSRKEPLRQELFQRVWQAYRAIDAPSFLSLLADVGKWAGEQVETETVRNYVAKLVGKAAEYAAYYQHPGQRTSNMVDRAMRRLEKFLRNRQYFHGHFASAQQGFRAAALCYNFAPFCPRARQGNKHLACRAADLNQFVYSQESWLHNLLIAASRNGCRNTHQIR